jgi:hypothetical protein
MNALHRNILVLSGNILNLLPSSAFLNKALHLEDEWLKTLEAIHSYLAIIRCSTFVDAIHSLFLIEARNACIMLHFYNLATVALQKFILPTDTPYLFERLGQLRIKSLCHCLHTFQKDDRLLKREPKVPSYSPQCLSPQIYLVIITRKWNSQLLFVIYIYIYIVWRLSIL